MINTNECYSNAQQQYKAVRSAVGLLDHEPACCDNSHLLKILSRST